VLRAANWPKSVSIITVQLPYLIPNNTNNENFIQTAHKSSFILLLLSLTAFTSLHAQNTVVKGTITDAKTHKPMPYVTVTFAGSTIGGGTNTQGRYSISTTEKYSQIQITFVGFKTATRTIEAGKEQEINIALIEDNQTLSEVVVKSGKKKKYTNKDNPAVALIRQVIAHKEQNQLEDYNFAEYKQYERMSFSLSNLSEKFKNKRIFKNYQFLFKEQDSTLIGGKTLLPLYTGRKTI
jgi:hypothetical protein